MAVDPKLINALVNSIGVSRRHVNRLIDRTATQNHLTRELAALKLASQRGLSVHRYATPGELAELRGVSAHVSLAPAPASEARAPPVKAKTLKTPKPKRDNSIFVVHGRNLKLRDDMYAFLRAIGLFPMEWDQAIKAARGGANPIVGNVIHDAMKKVQGVMVLLSPDELAKLRSPFVDARDIRHGLHKLEGQPRPNVILEAGLALGAHSDKTILVQVGDIREISDIAGKHMVHLKNSAASRKSLAQRLKDKLKFKINLDGTAWLDAGNFDRY